MDWKHVQGCTLDQPGKYDWTVRVWRWCGLMSNYLQHLFQILQFIYSCHLSLHLGYWQCYALCQTKMEIRNIYLLYRDEECILLITISQTINYHIYNMIYLSNCWRMPCRMQREWTKLLAKPNTSLRWVFITSSLWITSGTSNYAHQPHHLPALQLVLLLLRLLWIKPAFERLICILFKHKL